jgi:uncharacterized protein YdeI (BOF family)
MKTSCLVSMTAMAALLAGAHAHATDAPMRSHADLTHNDYVTLSGTVGKVLSGDEFELNYGAGMIKVDTNDAWPELFQQDRDKAAYRVKTGDRVTVTGRVDKNWMTANEIEAETITYGSGAMTTTYRHPKMRGTWFERNLDYFREGGRMSLTGTVTEIKNDHEFILQYAGGTMQVDTDGIAIPSANRIAVGERVTVYGTYDKGLTERNEIQAEGIDRSDYYSRTAR